MDRMRTSSVCASRWSRWLGCCAAILKFTGTLLSRKKPGEMSQGSCGGTQGFWAPSEAARREQTAVTAGKRMAPPDGAAGGILAQGKPCQCCVRAGDRIRTGDVQLGKLADGDTGRHTPPEAAKSQLSG